MSRGAMKVPRFNSVVSDGKILRNIYEAIGGVIEDGRFVDGPWVGALEKQLSSESVVCVGSGTDALALSIMAACTKKTGKVAVPALTFSATASAVYRAGFEPVVVDVYGDSMTIDEGAVYEIDHRVDGVIPVHLYGRRSDTLQTKCPVVEDACQVLMDSSRFGELQAFSFFPTKPLGCYGDGGAVLGEEDLVEKIRCMAHHGAKKRYMSEVVGFNSRLDSIQAAVLLSKLPYARQALDRRRQIALTYNKELQEHEVLKTPEDTPTHSWHIYALRVRKNRDGLLRHLRQEGIDSVVQYPPLHQQPAFSECPKVGTLHNSTKVASEVLSLPLWSGMSDAQVEYVIDVVRSYV